MLKSLSKTYKGVFLLILLISLIFIPSCSYRYAQVPNLSDEISLDDMLKRLNSINDIEAVLSVEYESSDNSMSGDALLKMSKDSLNLRIYYLGFLVGEVSEKEGIIMSNPKLSRNKSAILIDGLRNSLFWWYIEEYTRLDGEDLYILENSFKRVFIDKKTFLPIRQTVELRDGERLEILYEIPKRVEESEKDTFFELWYNSKITFKLKNHIATIKIKNLKIL